MTPSAAPRKDSLAPGLIARANDVWLTGSRDHVQSALDFADHIALVAPHIPHLIRVQRAMLGRMVRYLVDQGVQQFLDLGSGIPTGGHVHEIAQAAEPGCRVVYVDAEPGIAQAGQKIVAGDQRVAYLCADIRQVDDVVNARETRRLIDFQRPVAVLVIEALLHMPDTEDPDGMVAGYVDLLSPGSYLGISHFEHSDAIEAGYAIYAQMFGDIPFGDIPLVHLRGPARQAMFFTGLELVEPGIAPVQLWKPDPGDTIDRNPELTHVYAGLGRKQ